MLKKSSLNIIKEELGDTNNTSFLEQKCIDFVKMLKDTTANDDNEVATELLIDVSLAPMKKYIDGIENVDTKETVMMIYNILYKVSRNELLNK